jgi:hypothetical protein
MGRHFKTVAEPLLFIAENSLNPPSLNIGHLKQPVSCDAVAFHPKRTHNFEHTLASASEPSWKYPHSKHHFARLNLISIPPGGR